MPELPEVETVRRGLAKAIIGKKIASFDCDTPKMINFPLKKYQTAIKGLKIADVKRRAKMIVIELTGRWRFLIHLKMTGQLVFRDKRKCLIGGHTIDKSCETLPNKFTHATFTFSDQSRLYYNDIRKFGWLRLYEQAELATLFAKMELGPEPLAAEFTLERFTQGLRRRPNSRIKQFIMDARNVVGVGNIYADEVCYFAGLRPDRPAKSLSPADIKKVFQGIKKILAAAIAVQGTTFSNYVNAHGEAGGYTKKLKVYQRYGQKCLRCGGEIRRQKIGGRTSSYCPSCQK
ncbi:MAG: bifunctional DNA-formamidopyrimidine glycosylase/DNA-(apurinic or apyrimidinic site) lyase [Candidatus Margulisbacteria bacterium]|nr:bifunctional DNA-formamidopyrimidine glycosylase/DNA-(apurinic or apyrimidinic site) lyase [Candidatus Margulisiibacteriota bacterium]MBU1617333.1 bifunctional DNA-formamidopyrimidine glycosylase/DNA-(apurinic or apyrimidinic site) lyase [Candidatus Margulisiibacteriota bacterium]